MESSENVSQRDIAKRVGVSVMTVSRALSGRGSVAKKVRTHILNVANELGYRQNPLVRSLMRCRTRRRAPTISLTIAWYGDTSSFNRKTTPDPHYDTFAEYFRGAARICQRRGFRLTVFHPREVQLSTLPRILRARGIEGLLLGPSGRLQRESLSPVTGIPIVEIGRSRDSMGNDRVTSSGYRSARRCVRYLLDHGYKKVGYVDSQDRLQRGEERARAGFSIETLGKRAPVMLLDRQPGLRRKLEAFIHKHKPDALMIGGNQAMSTLLRMKLTIPFVVLGRSGLPGWITGTEARHNDIGAEAAIRLIDHIEGPKDRPLTGHSISLAEAWHEGTSHLPNGNHKG